jgi:hypothetical protein
MAHAMYLPPNSKLQSKLLDLFGIEHRGESFEHAADLVRFVLLSTWRLIQASQHSSQARSCSLCLCWPCCGDILSELASEWQMLQCFMMLGDWGLLGVVELVCLEDC